jgi:hypothetical protein
MSWLVGVNHVDAPDSFNLQTFLDRVKGQLADARSKRFQIDKDITPKLSLHVILERLNRSLQPPNPIPVSSLRKSTDGCNKFELEVQ